MGGTGAKERRKLERQQKGESVKSTPAKKIQNTKFRSGNRRPKEPEGDKRGNVLKKKGASGSYPKKTPKKLKEKSFKKPKHLKRKLDSAEDETTKEKLLQEIQLFETKKSKLVTHKPPKQMAAPGSTTNENRSSREQEMDKVELEENFPRSNRKSVREEKIVEEETLQNNANEKEKKQAELEEMKSEKPSEPEKKMKKNNNPVAENNKSRSDDSSSSSDSASSSDEDEEKLEQEQSQQTRTRGRGRKGRKSTSQQVEEEKKEEGLQTEFQTEERNATDTTKEGNRYCVGRKPVTDFKVGEKYSGKVVYMKPFGVFLDIGCHSDAFCHISRISDEYVEKPEDLFKEGDQVEGVRIVEVDRKNKRLTASLQSEARIADEHASMKARKERKEKNKNTKGRSGNAKNSFSKQAGHGSDYAKPSTISPQHKKFASSSAAPAFEEKSSQHQKSAASSVRPASMEKKTAAKSDPESLLSKPESEMTPAELKRARKIARRAARRAEQETEQ